MKLRCPSFPEVLRTKGFHNARCELAHVSEERPVHKLLIVDKFEELAKSDGIIGIRIVSSPAFRERDDGDPFGLRELVLVLRVGHSTIGQTGPVLAPD